MRAAGISSLAFLAGLSVAVPARGDTVSAAPSASTDEPPAPPSTPTTSPPAHAAMRQAMAADGVAAALFAASLPVMMVEAFSCYMRCVGRPVWQMLPYSLSIDATAFGLYALGPPVVHLSHHHPLRALADLGIRLGAPLALGALGYVEGEAEAHCLTSQPYPCSGSDPPGPLYAVLGGLVGMAAAALVDYAVLFREELPQAASPAPTGFTWSPAVALGPDRAASAGVQGAF
jgi:hypothetical protein